MKISVIIPTYKPQNYLWECLDSLTAQTFPKKDFEVVLVLNGCAEPYKSSIGKYIEENMQGMNVNFIQTDVGGVSNARNIALDNALGEYVTFIDDDDFVSPKYLEGLYLSSTKNTIALSYPFAFKDGAPEEQQLSYKMTRQYETQYQDGEMPYNCARKFFSGPCMKLIPTEFMKNRRFDVNFKNGEDSLFMFYLSDRFSLVRFADKDVCYYRRIRANSAYTSQTFTYRLKNALRLILAYCKIYFRNPLKYSCLFFLTRIIGACRSVL